MPLMSPRDFDVVGHIFSHLKVEPNLPGYMAHREKLGERGLAVGYLQGTAGPMQHIMKELMTLEQFFYALNDYPEKVQHLAEQIQHLRTDAPDRSDLAGGSRLPGRELR